jgi:hypothetical protein
MTTRRAAWSVLLLALALGACRDSTAAHSPPPALAVAAGQPTQTSFVSNGAFGNLSWFTTNPDGSFTFGFLDVNRGDAVSNPRTFLFYVVVQCTPSFFCVEIEGGNGLISNSDLSGGGKELHLRTNTSGNPDFFVFAGSGGMVTADWVANGVFSHRGNGVNLITMPADTLTADATRSMIRQQGTFTSTSADASGGIVGVSIPPGSFAWQGTNHNVTITISR